MNPLGSHPEEHSSTTERHGYVAAFRGELSAGPATASAGTVKSSGERSLDLLQCVLDGLREL